MSWALNTAQCPVGQDRVQGQATLTALGLEGPMAALIAGAVGSSNHLARLCAQEAVWLQRALKGVPKAALDALLDPISGDVETVAISLRQRKRRIGLLVALCDLGSIWPLMDVTGALTRFADFAVSALIRASVADAKARGQLPDTLPWHAGLVALAMGKAGARELNYSSDIDLIFLINESNEDADGAIRSRLLRITRRIAAALDQVTAEGYVFRTDLRLRPDAATTPVALPIAQAERYYRDHGRTWERAAMIKARAAAGDTAAGEALLERLRPWIFRRHLDFPALEDVYSIIRAIRDHKGLTGPITVPGHDLKLGRGGIREIEFFTQTLQLIWGGRDRSLRARGTLQALAALQAASQISERDSRDLAHAYKLLRMWEHRIQMLDDAQTHRLPLAEDRRARVADLAGGQTLAAFDRQVAECLTSVHSLVEKALAPVDAAPVAPVQEPERFVTWVARWRGLPVARAERAAKGFERVLPNLIAALEAEPDPDRAAERLDLFFTGLHAGVQTLSVLEADPALVHRLVSLCTAAPRIARHLGERPALLEAMLRADFLTSTPDQQSHTATLTAAITECRDLEQTLDAVRREANDARHQIAVQALLGKISPERAGQAYADIAESSLRAVLPWVIDDIARRHGPPPGHGLAVLAMGKLGTREMTATSDLDLIMVYDPGDATQSTGERPLDPGQYYARLTRALTGAITVPTAEGALYEVDMRLRPSGRQGPVAVPFDGFRRYQLHEAWGWEHLALTRARVVAGPEQLRDDIASVLQAVRALPREVPVFLSEIRDMRTRLADAKGAARPWDLKHGPGRLLDVDLFVQAGILLTGSTAPPDSHAIEILHAEGWLTPTEADTLGQNRRLLTAAQSALRIIWGESGALEPGDPATEAALARMTGHTSLESLQTSVDTQTALAAEVITARVATV